MKPGGAADLERRMGRVEALIESIERSGDEALTSAASELLATVLELHRDGLGRMVRLIAGAGGPGRALAEACARDEVIHALLTLHDLEAEGPVASRRLVRLRVPGREDEGEAATAPEPAPPDLRFEVMGASVVEHAAAPMLALDLAISDATPGGAVEALLLRCQVRIEPQLRGYSAAEEEALVELFGEPSRWERTARPFLWTHALVSVPPFRGEVRVELPLPCSSDLVLASARYFHGLDEGEAPLLLLFSGTVFHAAGAGALQAAQLPWSKEARYGLPVRVWRAMIDHHYPDRAGLLVRHDLVERLHQHRREQRLAGLDQALESILEGAGARVRP